MTILNHRVNSERPLRAQNLSPKANAPSNESLASIFFLFTYAFVLIIEQTLQRHHDCISKTIADCLFLSN